MGWIVALIVGGVAGWLASLVMNRDASMGIFWNIVVGCVGSIIGNLVANQFGIAGSVKEFSIIGLVVAFVGAVILLGVTNLFYISSEDTKHYRAASYHRNQTLGDPDKLRDQFEATSPSKHADAIKALIARTVDAV